MKKRKSAAFVIGFFMLFWLPSEPGGFLFYFFVWLPVAVLLIAYSGAFINPWKDPRKDDAVKQ